jgi:hypothetical protein
MKETLSVSGESRKKEIKGLDCHARAAEEVVSR